MYQGVAAAFQQAANDDHKPAMIVIDTIDAGLGARLAAELQSRPDSIVHGAAIIDMTPETASTQAQDEKVLSYTRDMSQAVGLQQPIIALVDLAGLDDADRRVALTGIALGLNYDIHAYHVLPAAADTDEPPAFAGGAGGETGGMEFQQVTGGPDATSMAKLIGADAASSRGGSSLKKGARKSAAKKPGKGGMGK